MTYLDELSRELRAVGIGSALRSRILAEIADHLACDPAAELGDPAAIAHEFADELGTSRSRRAAFTAFGALALGGVVYGTVYLTAGLAGLDPAALHPRTPLLAGFAAVDIVLAPQLAFVAGTLAMLRALRRRRAPVVPAAEARILLRRAGLALATGIATMAGIALMAYEYSNGVGQWWQVLAYTGSAIGAGAMLLALPPLVSAARVRHSAPGGAGDVFDDLGPLVPARLRGRPWPFALAVSGVVFAGVTVSGVVADDPFDGALRGLLDGGACLAGFAVLGGFLGLYRRRPEPPQQLASG